MCIRDSSTTCHPSSSNITTMHSASQKAWPCWKRFSLRQTRRDSLGEVVSEGWCNEWVRPPTDRDISSGAIQGLEMGQYLPIVSEPPPPLSLDHSATRELFHSSSVISLGPPIQRITTERDD